MNRDRQRLFERFQHYGSAAAIEKGGTPYEHVVPLSEEIGTGYRLEISLCPGLKLYLEKYTLREGMTADVAAEQYPLGISVCLSGRIDWTPSGRLPLSRYMTTGGKMYLSIAESGPDNGIIDCRPDEPVVMISLLVEPDRLGSFVCIPDIMHTAFRTSGIAPGSFCCLENRICPSMELAARQLINCELKGASRRFYLIAKTFELMALTAECYRSAPATGATPPHSTPGSGNSCAMPGISWRTITPPRRRSTGWHVWSDSTGRS